MSYFAWCVNRANVSGILAAFTAVSRPRRTVDGCGKLRYAFGGIRRKERLLLGEQTMKKLIAYYSRAGENYFSGAHRAIAVGNTEKAAWLLAELTGAELFHIEQKVPYSDNYDTCVAEARRDLRANARPELTALPESLDDYDEIFLGYPNYCGTMPMAVYTFLEHYDWQGKTIHPFCTNEGSGLSNTEQDIRRAAKGARVARGLSLRGSAVEGAKPKLEQWLRG